jgi:predicted ATPase/DNA-binding winged helix-turn-helix (wHTH) protein
MMASSPEGMGERRHGAFYDPNSPADGGDPGDGRGSAGGLSSPTGADLMTGQPSLGAPVMLGSRPDLAAKVLLGLSKTDTVDHSGEWTERAAVAPTTPSETTYCFGEFRLIPHRQLLLRNSVPVRIGTRALDLLHLLVERFGEMVSKDQLIRFAWPDTFVDESNLKVNISALRAVLGRAELSTAYIATIPGRGYRFVAPVQIERDAAPARRNEMVRVTLQNMPSARKLFGRKADIADLSRDLLATGFLTVTGPPGVGKTAVAAAVARELADHYESGACFIDFTAIADPRLANTVIASALGFGGHLYDLPAIVDALRCETRLLIFDNCEHLPSAICVVVDHLRTHVPDVAILCTSREPLGCRSEHVRRLATMAAPGQDAIPRDAAVAHPAVELFLDRARAASGYELVDADVAAVVGICRRLDGLALAIELAASRSTHDRPGSILDDLTRGADLLNHGPRFAPSRQQSLTAALEWSYRLLTDAEAKVFRLASAFAEPFTCEDLIGIADGLDLSPEDAARCVSNLAAKSLLEPSFSSGRLAYRMLGITRRYAAARRQYADPA